MGNKAPKPAKGQAPSPSTPAKALPATVRILIVGDIETGKTSTLYRLRDGNLPDPAVISATTQDTLFEVVHPVPNGEIKLRLMDTAGQEKFRKITVQAFNNCQIVVLMIDVTNQETLDHVQGWMEHITNSCPEGTYRAIVANKIDMAAERAFSNADLKTVANDYQLPFWQISAKTGAGTKEFLKELVDGYIKFI